MSPNHKQTGHYISNAATNKFKILSALAQAADKSKIKMRLSSSDIYLLV